MLFEKRLVVWGDSIMKGIIEDESGEYCVAARPAASQLAEYTGCMLENRSMFGLHAFKALARMQLYFRQNPLQPGDTVLIELGGNDCDFLWKEIAEHPEQEHQPKTPLHEFRYCLKEMVGLIRSAGADPVLMSPPPLEPERYFRHLSRGLDGERILNWLGDVDRIYRWQELYSSTVATVAREMDVPFLPTRELFLEHGHYQSLYCSDGIHPNAEGQNLLFEAMKGFVEQRHASRTA